MRESTVRVDDRCEPQDAPPGSAPPSCVPADLEDTWREFSIILPTPSETVFLRACLVPGEAAIDEGWRALLGTRRERLTLSTRTSLYPPLSDRLRKDGVSLDRESLARSRRLYAEALAHTHRYWRVWEEVADELSRAGIPFIMLKGAAFGSSVYPRPELRLAGDIDLLLREEDLAPASASLRASGWQWMHDQPDFGRHHIAPLVHPSGLHVDLHRRLFLSYYHRPIEDLWNGSRALTVRGRTARMLSCEDNLIHVCAHAARCVTRASLRWVADAWFIVHAPDLDWSHLNHTVARGRLALPMAVTLSYLESHLGAPIPAATLAQLWADARSSDRLALRRARVGAMALSRLEKMRHKERNVFLRGLRIVRHLFPSPTHVRLAHGIEGPLFPYYVYLFRQALHRVRHVAARTW